MPTIVTRDLNMPSRLGATVSVPIIFQEWKYDNNENNELTDNDPPIWRHSMGGSLCLSSVDLKSPPWRECIPWQYGRSRPWAIASLVFDKDTFLQALQTVDLGRQLLCCRGPCFDKSTRSGLRVITRLSSKHIKVLRLRKLTKLRTEQKC